MEYVTQGCPCLGGWKGTGLVSFVVNIPSSRKVLIGVVPRPTPSPCSIIGFTDHCTTHILLAAYGNGSCDVENTPVMRGAAWSCSKLLEQPLCLHCSVKDEEQVASLPTDFQMLLRAGNLHSFLTIPIATDHEVLGALTIAKEDPDGFEVDWCALPVLMGVGIL